MSEYRRFVSYMYEYTNGKKNKNTGFAKVESRNGICRMQIHLQKIPQEEETLNIYGFVREGGWLLGIFLGQIGVKNACGDARIQTQAERIGGSAYRLEQIAGLWVESGLGRTYLTVFDDEGVDTEKLVTALPDEKKPEEEPQEEASAEAQEELREEASAEAQEEPREEASAEAAEELREEASVEAEDLREEASAEAAEEPREEASAEAAEEPREEVSAEAEEELREEASVEAEEEELREEASVEAEEEPQGEASVEAEEEPQGEPSVETEEQKERVHAQQAGACPAVNSRCANCSWHMANLNQKWQALSRRYPHFQPFAEGEFADCLQITPRELAFIGQGKCRVGNNSFLMHGFCNYRHLLFGKRRDGRFVLGVPGVFENQEMVMANMYGFPDFKEAMAKHPNGKFGYWCREL